MPGGCDGGGAERFRELLDSLQAQYDQDINDSRSEVLRLLRSKDTLEDLRSLGQAEGLLPEAPRDSHISLPTSPNGVVKENSLRSLRNGYESLQLASQWAFRNKGDSITDGGCGSCIDYEESFSVTDRLRRPSIALKDRGTWLTSLLNPNATWRTWWAFLGLGMVLFDLIHVPLQAFNMPPHVFFDVMDWITLLFWTFDIGNTLLCGYWDNGEVVLSLRRIACNYLKSWFLIDMVIVVPDWLQKIVMRGDDAGGSSLARLLRGARAVRVLRLLRISKLQRIITKLYDLIDNEYSFIWAELVKMMLAILFLNHFIACGWFLVGTFSNVELGLASWVTWSENFKAQNIGYQYTTALHWTLTQFTPASMDVVARNILERLYSIGVLLFAMVAFSSIVGTVTTSMTLLRNMKEDKQKQLWKLRRYLKQRNVSSDLSMRMIRFVEYQCTKQEKTIQSQNVVLLARISDQLGSELAHEMHSPFLLGHPFQHYVSKEMKGIAFRICHMAIESSQVATGDVMFSAGEEAFAAFVMKSGNLSYILRYGNHLLPPIGVKEWLAEAVLWAPWRYRGTCHAASPSEILALNAQQFAKAMSHHPKAFQFARRYGERFVRYFNIGNPADWTDVLRDEEFINLAVSEGTECEEKLLQLEADEDRAAAELEAEGSELRSLDDEEGAQDATEVQDQATNASRDAEGAGNAAASSGAWQNSRVGRITPLGAPKSWVSKSLMGTCFTSCTPCTP